MTTMAVPGAHLYYELRGAGPVLLLLQSGGGDALRTNDLVDRLAGHYTVVTCDRRSLSHNTLEAEGPVTHEPMALRLLPAATRAPIAKALADLGTTYREHGADAARQQMVAVAPNHAGLEPGVVVPAPTKQWFADLGAFLGRDVPAVVDYNEVDFPDLAALRSGSARIVPAGGVGSREIWPYRCAQVLAERLGVGLAEFPGGHTGATSHPTAFAARLREVFDAA